jgi:hypothetical protein|tara:strand:+ start:599 stop:2008 length:1410 start_codon:yes stop_codon:yes gene_type:complete
MSLIDVAAELEYVPQEQLVQLMNDPNSRYPQYLVLSEVQRRTQLRKMYENETAKMQQPKTTVAEEAIMELQSQGAMPRQPGISSQSSGEGLSSMAPPSIGMSNGGLTGATADGSAALRYSFGPVSGNEFTYTYNALGAPQKVNLDEAIAEAEAELERQKQIGDRGTLGGGTIYIAQAIENLKRLQKEKESGVTEYRTPIETKFLNNAPPTGLASSMVDAAKAAIVGPPEEKVVGPMGFMVDASSVPSDDETEFQSFLATNFGQGMASFFSPNDNRGFIIRDPEPESPPEPDDSKSYSQQVMDMSKTLGLPQVEMPEYTAEDRQRELDVYALGSLAKAIGGAKNIGEAAVSLGDAAMGLPAIKRQQRLDDVKRMSALRSQQVEDINLASSLVKVDLLAQQYEATNNKAGVDRLKLIQEELSDLRETAFSDPNALERIAYLESVLDGELARIYGTDYVRSLNQSDLQQFTQ